MSSGTLPEQESQPELPLSSIPPREMAPSEEREDEPTVARWLGGIGWTLAATGGMVVALNLFMGPRLVPSSMGYVGMFLGLAMMLYHSARDGDLQIRRYYGFLGMFFLAASVVLTLIPGAAPGVTAKSVGFFFLPYGAGALLIALAFMMTFATRESDKGFRDRVLFGEFLVGVGLAAACFLGGLINPDFLLGAGLVVGLIGLLYLSVFIGQMGSASDLGYQVGLLVGAIGLLAMVYALGRSVVPVLATPERAKTLFMVGGGFLVVAFIMRWLFGGTALTPETRLIRTFSLGVGLLGVLTLLIGGVGATKMFVGTSIPAFFIPYGLVMLVLGGLYLVVSIGTCSDSQFVVLTRRELTAYFYSPIAYLVLFGFMLAGWINYFMFVSILVRETASATGAGVMMEPIVSRYIYSLIPVMSVTFVIPAITMRLMSEEQRTGTLEVLFTAPVREITTVLSKFMASWIFYMFLWIPWALFLVVLRVEGGSSFDYRPLLGFFVALGACGAAFLAMGLFFSSLTKNQIVAAVLTFAGMMGYVLCHLIDFFPAVADTSIGSMFRHLSFLDLWQDALSGKLALSDIFLHLSLAAFWLYLTVKTLESRRWK